MTEQLVLELTAPEPPSFANFLVGSNAEAVAALTRLANGTLPETGLVVWGAPGAGKSHLLRATGAAAAARGRRVVHCDDPAVFATRDPALLGPCDLVVIDAIDTADDAAQAQLFTAYNTLRAGGHHLLAASSVPPARMSVRDDLRTRLGWGLVYEVVPLSDEDKPAALLAYARRRGFTLAPDVISYLLVHGRRDMATLLATLAALDRHSLSTKRPVTIAMLRAWLQREIGV